MAGVGGGGRKGGRSSRMEVDDKDLMIRVCAGIASGFGISLSSLTLTPPTHTPPLHRC